MLISLGCNSGDFSDLDTYKFGDTPYYLAPTFYDLQVNGYDGVMLDVDMSVDNLKAVSKSLKRDGVYRFVPTMITCSYEHMLETLENIRAFMSEYPGVIPGVHLEGPFISLAKKGIHEARFVRKMTSQDLESLLKYKDEVSYITVSPEQVSEEQVKTLVEAGIQISIGHTKSSFADVSKLITAGARLATHLYNAMDRALGGRDPRTVEAVLASDTSYVGIIADGIHVAWPELVIAHKCLQDRLVLVTDALAGAGASSKLESFTFAGTTIINDPLKGCINKDGTLGGSRLTMQDGVRNLVKYASFRKEEALMAATVAPYKAMQEEPKSYAIYSDDLTPLKFIEKN